MIKEDINSLVKIHLENELLARGKQVAIEGGKKVAKVAIGVPVASVALLKFTELTGRKLSQV